MKIEQSSPK